MGHLQRELGSPASRVVRRLCVGAVTVCSATYCSEIGSMRSARGKDHRPCPPDLLFEIIARYGKAEHFDCAGLRFGNRRDGLAWLDRRRDCEGLRSDGGLSRLQGGGALWGIVGCDGGLCHRCLLAPLRDLLVTPLQIGRCPR